MFMGTAPTPATPGRFSLSKNGSFLEDKLSVGLQVDGSRDPAVAMALATNATFPQAAIKLASVSVKASGGADVKFASKQGPVSFSGSASVSSGIGVYLQPSDL